VPPNRQRLALACAALLGALTPLLPWARVGVYSAPLTVDAAGTGLVSGAFLVACGLALAGDRSQPLRASLPAAVAVSIVGAGLLGFVIRAAVLTASDDVELGTGAYFCVALALSVGVGAWLGPK
jgi:hypothetical protein